MRLSRLEEARNQAEKEMSADILASELFSALSESCDSLRCWLARKQLKL
jgi:hypothetical protein